MAEDKKRVFVIDGYGQIYRSYFAFFNNPLKDKNGNNVSAIFGFFNNLMMLVRQFKPDYLVVALDSKGKTFRHEIFPEYKANREKTPEDLHAQIPVIVNMLDAMNIHHFERIGMEADDIIATISNNATAMGLETVIVTGDKDLMQLVDENVSALRPPRKGEHDYRLCKASEVEEIFGVRPDQICDYLTILGDSSDNVPGIDGIGEKGAVKLLKEFGTLSSVYENIDSLSAGLKTKLENARNHIQLSHSLIELKNDLFSYEDVNLDDYAVSSINWINAIQEFYSIGSDTLVRSAKRFVSPELDMKFKAAESHFASVSKPKTNKSVKLPEYVKKDYFTATEKPQLEEKNLPIAFWLLNSSKSEPSMEDIMEKYLPNTTSDNGNSLEENSLKELCRILGSELEQYGLSSIFNKIEVPLVDVLAQMEEKGILLDVAKMKDYEAELKRTIQELENDIYNISGHPFNINSPKQLQEVLFSERGLTPVKKTKSGYSTDSDVLEELSFSSEDPIPSMILRYRGLSKLLSTYVSVLPEMIDEDGRIHTTFVQTGTATGRLSAKNPNLQNIPIRTEEGRKIRDAFIPAKGCVFLSADYAQIELAVMASLSKDKALCSAFENGEDVHTKTASLIFSEFPEMVTAQQRRIAKTINFGVIYGMSAYRLSQELKISRSDAKNFIDAYFAQYPSVTAFIENIKEYASENLEVLTLLGHRRQIPEMASSNKTIRSAAERVAVNTVIQGTAAEIVKLAMLRVSEALKNTGLKAKLLLQVHDEIILEVPEEEINQVSALVKDCMENLNLLDIPLRVSIETGTSWGMMH